MDQMTDRTRVKDSISARKRRRDVWGWVMLTTSFLVLGGLFAVAYLRPPIDLDDRFCVKGQRPSKNIIVLVDQTDPFGKEMRGRVTMAIQSALNHVNRGEMISLFSFTGADTKGFAPVAQACSPGRRDEHNSLFESLDAAEEAYGKFRAIITEQMPAVTQDKFNPVSPILEVLKDLSEREEFIDAPAGSEIYLISDMRQNSDLSKFYDYKSNRPLAVPDEVLAASANAIFGERGFNGGHFDLVVYELLLKDANAAASDSVRSIWTRFLKGRVRSLTWKQA
jgi:hypothetical protein